MSQTINLQPLSDRVIVRPLVPETVTSSGIIIPDTANKEKPQMGTVIAVGPGKTESGNLIPVSVRVGDTVVYSKYSPDEIEHNGEKLLVMHEESILAVVKN